MKLIIFASRKSAPVENRKRGFTLTEAAIVLGVAGIVLAAVWVAGSSVYTNMRAAKAKQQITTLSTNIKEFYSTRNRFYNGGQDLIPELRNAGVIPADMINADGTLTSAIGGWVSIGSIGVGPSSLNVLVQINNITNPQEFRALAISTGGVNPISGLTTDVVDSQMRINGGGNYRSAANVTPAYMSTIVCSPCMLGWVFSVH